MSKRIYSALRSAGVSRLNLTLLITEQCNFRCDHCMFASGPSKPSAYMGREVFDYLADQVRVSEFDDGVNINLVGGEPTADLDQFELRWQWAAELADSTDAALEMTTNGWWLNTAQDCRRFLSIVVDEAENREYVIRVSDSEYHEQFRPREIARILRRHDELDESFVDDLADYWRIVCPDCGGELEYVDEDYVCMKCSAQWSETAIWMRCELPMWERVRHSISIDHQGTLNRQYIDALSKISATGRGRLIGGYQKPACRSDFSDTLYTVYITLTPNGVVRDFCCNGGSTVYAGKLVDRPLTEWLKISHGFLQEAKLRGVTCKECPAFARNWAKSLKPPSKRRQPCRT